MTRLNDNLNARRLELGLTYEQVHELLARYPWPVGVKPPSLAVVGHWFNGTRRPRNMEHLRGLCDVLEMTLDEAIKGAPNEAATGLEQALLDAVRDMEGADAEMILANAQRLRRRTQKP